MTLADIKDLFERKARAMTKRPSFAQGTGHASVRLDDAFACQVDVGDRRLPADRAAGDRRGGGVVVNDLVFRRVQRYGWDAASAIYEDGWAPRLADFGARCVQRARLRPGERVLDIATGPGLTAFRAGEAVGAGGG